MPLGASFSGILISLIIKSNKLLLASLSILYFFSIGFTSDLLISYVENPYEIIPLKNLNNANSIVVLGGMRTFTQKNQKLLNGTIQIDFLQV